MSLVRVVLVGPLLAASDGPTDAAERARELAAWADEHGFAVRALPAPGHWAHPDADAAHRRRLARADSAALTQTLAQVRRELDTSAGPVPTVIAIDEVAGQAGRAWLQRFRDAAERNRIELQRAVRVAVDEPLNTAHLDAVILDRV